MKKYLIIALLLATTAVTQGPVGRSLATLRLMVRYQLSTQGRATGQLTNTTVHYAINRAIAQVCAKYPAIDKMDTIVTTAGTMTYALNTDFDRIRIAYRFTADSVVSLQPKNVDTLAAMFAIKVSKNPGYYYTSGSNIVLLPVPTNYDGDSILIDYYAIDEMLTDSTDSTVIPQEYIEKVIELSCAILSATRKDYGDAMWYWQLFDDKRAPLEELKK